MPAGRPKGKRGQKLSRELRLQLLEMILDKQNSGLSDSQIGARFGVSHRTVQYYKKALALKNPAIAALLGDSRSFHTARGLPRLDTGEADKRIQAMVKEAQEKHRNPEEIARDMEEAISSYQHEHPDGNPTRHPRQAALAMKKGEGVLSISEMLQFLSEVARTGPPQYKIAAIKLLDELHAIHRPAESFAIPSPLTPEEVTERLTMLLSAVGAEAVRIALEKLAWLSTSSTNGTTQQLTWTPPESHLTFSVTPEQPSSKQEDGSSESTERKTSTSLPPTESSSPQESTTSEESQRSQSPSLSP